MNGEKKVGGNTPTYDLQEQKIFISDTRKTQCDQRASPQASSKWTAFFRWPLNLRCCRPFLLLQDFFCYGVVIDNDLGVCVQSAAERSPDSCFAI